MRSEGFVPRDQPWQWDTRPMYIYRPDERPDVEVEVDGSWYPGELRGWWERDSGRVMNVQWREAAGMTRLDTLPAERVRLGTS